MMALMAETRKEISAKNSELLMVYRQRLSNTVKF